MPTTKVTAAQFKQILVMRRTEVAQEKQRAEAARVSATKIAMDEKVAIVHMCMHMLLSTCTCTDAHRHIHTHSQKQPHRKNSQYLHTAHTQPQKITSTTANAASSTLPSPNNPSTLLQCEIHGNALSSTLLLPHPHRGAMNAPHTDLSRLAPSIRARDRPIEAPRRLSTPLPTARLHTCCASTCPVTHVPPLCRVSRSTRRTRRPSTRTRRSARRR